MAIDVPVTVWRDTNGLSEYASLGSNYLVDTLNNNIVDTLNNNIVDTGVTATLIPATIWEEDDSL